MARHVHAEMMIEAANNTSIEWQYKREFTDWQDCIGNPSWLEFNEYRKKPREFEEGHWYQVVNENGDGSVKKYLGHGYFTSHHDEEFDFKVSEFPWIGESLGKLKFG